jgi:iron-sulfur cluster assembly protein
MENTQTADAPAPVTEAKSSQPIVLTAAAVAQVKEVIRQQKFEGYTLTVRVMPAGCNGLGYDLNIVPTTKQGDLVWEQDGIKIATDPMSRQYLNGTQVDYVTSIQGAGFKFVNPNAKASCGCGTSFNT